MSNFEIAIPEYQIKAQEKDIFSPRSETYSSNGSENQVLRKARPEDPMRTGSPQMIVKDKLDTLDYDSAYQNSHHLNHLNKNSRNKNIQLLISQSTSQNDGLRLDMVTPESKIPQHTTVNSSQSPFQPYRTMYQGFQSTKLNQGRSDHALTKNISLSESKNAPLMNGLLFSASKVRNTQVQESPSKHKTVDALISPRRPSQPFSGRVNSHRAGTSIGKKEISDAYKRMAESGFNKIFSTQKSSQLIHLSEKRPSLASMTSRDEGRIKVGTGKSTARSRSRGLKPQPVKFFTNTKDSTVKNTLANKVS